MDPQAFIRLSVGSLGLRMHNTIQPLPSSSTTCCCEIRLRGFPVQTTTVPFITSPDESATAPPPPDTHAMASSFYLEDSDLKALSSSSSSAGCFHTSNAAYLEVAVFTGRKGSSHHCGVGTMKRQQIGSFKLEVSPEWGEGKSVTREK